MKNMAGFNRHFRFTGQKHICAAKKKAVQNVTIGKPN
jgi:hypothetical protein